MSTELTEIFQNTEEGIVSPHDSEQPPRRLRVLTFTTLFPNSVQPLAGTFILERLRHCVPYADISVVAPIPYFPPINLNPRWFEMARVPRRETYFGFDTIHPRYVVVPRIGMASHGLSMFAGSLSQVRAKLRSDDFDVIDAHYVYPDGLAAVLLGRMFRKPVVVSARGSDINEFSGLPTIKPLIRYVLKQADAVIAVAQSLKSRMVDLGCSEQKITVIGNGVDPVKFRPSSQVEARRNLGLPPNRRIILSVGHIIALKGFHIAASAIARVKRAHPDVLFVIVGEGAGRANLLAQVRAHGIEDNVLLAGTCPQDRLREWYSAADLFCLPSEREGWPNVVLEAMACGLPVIGTRVGSIPDIVSSPELGMLTGRTEESLASAFETGLLRTWNRDLIIAHARSHDWNKVAERQLAVYRNVVARTF